MGDTPLASLSLTHVHYVSYVIFSPFDLPLTMFPEPRGPTVLCLSMASPDSTGAMHFLCNLDMVNKGGGSYPDVCGTDGL